MSVHGPLGATEGGALELRAPARESRPTSLGARRGLIGLTGLLLCGLIISVAAAHTDLLLPESVRPVPSWLAGAFGSASVDIGNFGVIGVFIVMFACYAIAIRHAEHVSPRVVLMSIAALHALVLLGPPLLSTDVFSYQAYARMGDIYGANPYLQGPHAIALDPLYPFIGAKWVTTPTVYGPLFTVFSYILAPLSIAANALAYKALAAITSLATVAIVWNAARLRGVNSAKAAALVGLNPLLVVYGVGGGHNDLLMMAAVMAGVAFVLQHRERAGAAAIMLGAGVKLTAGVFLPFALAAGGHRLAASRRRDIMVGAATAGALVAGLGFAFFGTGPLHVLGTLKQVQSEGDWHSIPGFIGTELGLGAVGQVTGLLLAVLFAAVFCSLVQRVWQGRLDWIDGAGWVAVALLVTASSLLPWYVAWLIPLAALATDQRLWRIAVLLTGVIQLIQLVGYLPHGGSPAGV